MPHYDYESDTRAFSQVLFDIGQKRDPKLYLGELIDAFGERGIGAMMLFLGLLSAVIGAVPGTTTIIGIPMLLVCVQLVLRRDQLWLPRRALASAVERDAFRTSVAKVMKPLRWVERASRPRLLLLSSPLAEILIGAAASVMCVILILPLWGANLFPSLAVAAFGFGLMQRDGLVIIAGWVIATGFSLFLWLAWEVVSRLALSSWEWVQQTVGLG